MKRSWRFPVFPADQSGLSQLSLRWNMYFWVK
jgi:hypothetical protein